MINQIQEDTGADITIEDDGTIYIGATDGPAGRGGPRDDQRDRQPDHAGGRRALPGHGRQDHDLRRVRLAACRARTACCTSRRSASSPAASGSRTSRTCSRSATRSRSRSPRSTRAASSRWSRSSRARTPPRRGRVRPKDDAVRVTVRTRRTWRRAGRPRPARGAAVQRPVPKHAAQRAGRRRQVRRTVLPGGLRVVTETLPAVRSATFGIWVGVGSRDETPALDRRHALPGAPALQGHRSGAARWTSPPRSTRSAAR